MSSKRPEPSRRPSGSGGNAGRGGRGSRQPEPLPATADVGEIARAVSTSFLVLVFGSMLTPVVTSVLPEAIGQFWLIVVTLLGFALAGFRGGRAGPNPPLYGAGTALGAFALVIPLVFLLQGEGGPATQLDPLYIFVYTPLAALVVGGLAGIASARLAS